MEPIYIYRVQETGEITQEKVDEYIRVGKSYRVTDASQNMHYAYIKKMDTLNYGIVYSFNSNVDEIKAIITKRLSEKKAEAYEKYCKYEGLLNRVEKWGNKDV